MSWQTDEYKVIKKDSYHMYALGEIVKRLGSARILDTYVYVNAKGIMQRLTDEQVEKVVDTKAEQA
ncbi:hypothetical protein PJKIFABJ_00133 [Pseudomonas phage PE09]|uniref:Uncharacterized protein n=1 Tax=Pseudomonas phage PE09 TaxID=2696355 RepID=A0A9E6KRG6_9CAUD|nr:hypothetical protein QGX22_gp121 [Pseudomonas phage PE09]QHZ60069.1 hypothetical protein PJKIFABJ_00133 [Pseudomonas phage PE09]